MNFKGIRGDLRALAELFENAKTFGSLITVPEPLAGRMPEIAQTVEEKIGKWVCRKRCAEHPGAGEPGRTPGPEI